MPARFNERHCLKKFDGKLLRSTPSITHGYIQIHKMLRLWWILNRCASPYHDNDQCYSLAADSGVHAIFWEVGVRQYPFLVNCSG